MPASRHRLQLLRSESGGVRTLSGFASVHLLERADGQGLNLIAGLGPEWLLSRPTDRRWVRLAFQAGAGLAVQLGPAALLMEASYQRVANTAGELRQMVPVTMGVRIGSSR